jgi:mannose-6-phosphate isomerase-like protein (cupin superfamily)
VNWKVFMQTIDHQRQPVEEWRPGVTTRMHVSSVMGSMQLCLFEQWCDEGRGAPMHLHAVEEVLTVLEGTAEMWIEDERTTLKAGQSMIIPAGRRHGFSNVGQTTLHVQAILAAPIFEATFDDPNEVRRRWLPQPRASSIG